MKNFAVGAALGVLLGLLVGLSASEVVAGVITGLVGLLGTVLGLRSETAAGPIPGGNGARVGGFAIAMAAALLAGILVRTHGLLEPSPADRAALWIDAGLSPADAAALVAFNRTGLLPESRVAGVMSQQKSGTGALFSDSETLRSCDILLTRRYETVGAMESALRVEGGDWVKLIARVPVSLPEEERLKQLKAVVEGACEQH